MPAFLTKLKARLVRYGYSVSAGSGFPQTLPKFLVPYAKQLGRYGFTVT